MHDVGITRCGLFILFFHTGVSVCKRSLDDYHRQQPVDGHGPLLSLHVRHVILDDLIRDALRKLLTQLLYS